MNRFIAGFAAAWILDKIAWKIALSTGKTGSDVMRKWVARLDHDKLLRFQQAVTDEITRRRTIVP